MADLAKLQEHLATMLSIADANPALAPHLAEPIRLTQQGIRRFVPPPTINIPALQATVINMGPLEEGTVMVDFQGERSHDRYYTEEEYDTLPAPKLNPVTRVPILPGQVTYYTAHLDPSLPVVNIGGRRRRVRSTRRRRGKMSYTRLSRKR